MNFFSNLSLHKQGVINRVQQVNQNYNYVVVCYCAEWCRTCESYFQAFQELSQGFNEDVFLWVDIEEEPELTDDLDPENFPTILIQKNGINVFYGPVLPYIDQLKRLLIAVKSESYKSNNVKGPSALLDLLKEL